MKWLLLLFLPLPASAQLRIASFDVDATPPKGSPLAYVDMVAHDTPLHCRGVVLDGIGDAPVVLCSVDWIGIANEGQDKFKAALASAAKTTPERVAVHAGHQHDTPRCDYTSDAILAAAGHSNMFFNVPHANQVIHNAGRAVAAALSNLTTVTHIGVGQGTVDRIASNRRILGTNGLLRATRWTTCTSKALRALPAGTVDNKATLLTFYSGRKPLVALSWFACHPQSFYRTGVATPDYPGLARILREEDTGGLRHIHFAGAGGNIGAGKWNDGQRKNRILLARRLADGLEEAWRTTKRHPVDAEHIVWRTRELALPLADHLVETNLVHILETETHVDKLKPAAKHLAWLRRHQAGRTTTLGCLDLGPAKALFMPGELFVEYQMAAEKMRPDEVVVIAAYGEYGCGYICTEVAYKEGGYEPSARASLVAPSVEGVLMGEIRGLLQVP